VDRRGSCPRRDGRAIGRTLHLNGKTDDYEPTAGRRAGNCVVDVAWALAERFTPKPVRVATDAPAVTATAMTRGQQRIEIL